MDITELDERLIDTSRLMRLVKYKDRDQQGQFLKNIKAVEKARVCLKELIDPYKCPDCGNMEKIPKNLGNIRNCPECGKNNMFPEPYLRLEIIGKQVKLLLDCVAHMAKEGNAVAIKTMESVGQVKP